MFETWGPKALCVKKNPIFNFKNGRTKIKLEERKWLAKTPQPTLQNTKWKNPRRRRSRVRILSATAGTGFDTPNWHRHCRRMLARLHAQRNATQNSTARTIDRELDHHTHFVRALHWFFEAPSITRKKCKWSSSSTLVWRPRRVWLASRPTCYHLRRCNFFFLFIQPCLSLDLGQFCDAGISRNFAKFCLYTCVWILFAYGSSVMICLSSIFLMMIYLST